MKKITKKTTKLNRKDVSTIAKNSNICTDQDGSKCGVLDNKK